MKKLFISSFILILFLLTGLRSNAQDYKSAVGLKFGGYENGFSGKYFTTSDVSLEGLLGFRSHGVVFTGLYEVNQEAFGLKELKFYYGAGLHIGATGSGLYRRFNGSDQYYNDSHILLGIDGVLGLEYVIPQSPIAVSLDLNPRAELA
ncbi:MAG: hypothetical protein ACXVJD_11365, partial [Mucilaginibacter sp.]